MDNKWHRRYLDLALQLGQWSKHPTWKVGSVAIGDHGQVLSCGYNGWPRGIEGEEDYHLGSGARADDQPSLTVHAEANVIYNASLNGVSLNRSTLYVAPLFPCVDCTKAIIQVGVGQICHAKWVPVQFTFEETVQSWEADWHMARQLLRGAGVKVIELA